jgi:hypothetical protein
VSIPTILKALDETAEKGKKMGDREFVKNLLRVIGVIALLGIGWVFGQVKENSSNQIIKDAQEAFDKRYIQVSEFNVLKAKVDAIATTQSIMTAKLDINTETLARFVGSNEASIKNIERALERIESKRP